MKKITIGILSEDGGDGSVATRLYENKEISNLLEEVLERNDCYTLESQASFELFIPYPHIGDEVFMSDDIKSGLEIAMEVADRFEDREDSAISEILKSTYLGSHLVCTKVEIENRWPATAIKPNATYSDNESRFVNFHYTVTDPTENCNLLKFKIREFLYVKSEENYRDIFNLMYTEHKEFVEKWSKDIYTVSWQKKVIGLD